MTDLSISRIKESTYVTVSMIVLCVAGVISWVFLMAGTAAVEAQDDEFGNFAVDVGFSWWLMVYTGALYICAMLAWIGSIVNGVGLFVALSQPLALLFAIAFAWIGVEMRAARLVTGDVRPHRSLYVSLTWYRCDLNSVEMSTTRGSALTQVLHACTPTPPASTDSYVFEYSWAVRRVHLTNV